MRLSNKLASPRPRNGWGDRSFVPLAQPPIFLGFVSPHGKLGLDRLVALATRFFSTFAIENNNLTATMLD